jgi:energy-coupling factor transporter ATP-binding protein EcfA2
MYVEQTIPLHSVEAETSGVPNAFLTEMLLRHLSRMGELPLFQIAKRMGMSPVQVLPLLVHMRALQLIEVPRRGETEGDVSYALTDGGRKQAALAFERCQYVGPAPVPLWEYVDRVNRQSLRHQPTTVQRLKDAMGTLVLEDDLLPTLGSALNSGKAIYLYGPSGTGKSYLAEHLVKTLQGEIWVPHAIYVEGEVIQVFDPTVHHAVEQTVQERHLSRDEAADGRWVRVARPVVVTAGELTLQMLDLEFDRMSRLYVAPPQMKANNGILVVDDLGRQRVSARDLLNRWIVPLDRHVDYLGLHTGATFEVPFDVTVIFASNLTPEELTDPAFARRLGYKIAIGAMSQEGYRTVIAQACKRVGVTADPVSIDFMIERLHPSYEQAYLPCIPYDVISKIRDRALYLGQTPRLTPDLIEWAWKTYFGAGSQPQPGLASNGFEERRT